MNQKIKLERTVQPFPDAEGQLTLESGVVLQLYERGPAMGSDGKEYYAVLQERRETYMGIPDVVAYVVGWSSDLKQEVVFPPKSE